MTNYEKLRGLLAELFQFDQADLDFGIYRIMNQKRDEISRFLDEDLLPQVRQALEEYQSTVSSADLEELQEAIKHAQELGVDPDTSPKVVELKAKCGELVEVDTLEDEVFSHLYDFFRRYYDEGDFISLRRYKEGVYAIPYEGEEVKLYWANHDQYYIKSTENFRDYTFRVPDGRTVQFRIVEAEVDRDNNKPAEDRVRRFVLAGDDPVAVEDNQLVIRFHYAPIENTRIQQTSLNPQIAEAILSSPVASQWSAALNTPQPTSSNGDRSLLEKHLVQYTARNTFDYFIHKDLGGFLRRELDFFIKNEIMRLDDIEDETAPRVEQFLGKIRALRRVAGKIIAFLAQLEDFQKKLWLKKKFVLETNWCVTLDRVPEELYPEILANEAQVEEWRELYAIDEIGDGLFADQQLDESFLRQNPFLVVDTAHFSRDFTEHLVAVQDDLDEQTDGLLISGENLQSLMLMSERYGETLTCAYIDPPYNTDASAILYKNDYKDSSWLALMRDRLQAAHGLLAASGIICCAIDDEEVTGLRLVLNDVYAKELGVVVVRSNPAGRKTKGRFAPAHEYALFHGKSPQATPVGLDPADRRLDRYPLVDEAGRFCWANLIRSGSGDKREDRPTMFYPIFVSRDDVIRIPEMTWDEQSEEYILLEEPAPDVCVVYPVATSGSTMVEKRWHRGHERVASELEEYRVRRLADGNISIDFKARMDESSLPTTWWAEKEYASANYGAAQLKAMFGTKVFDFAKSRRLVEDCVKVSCAASSQPRVIDFFAGSGTTGHAVISLNRDDGGNRKYILVEMGLYFDTVLLPRIKKVIYSDGWRDGRPTTRKGSSHLLKYIRLESYEDTLNNLVLEQTPEQQRALTSADDQAREEFMLGYMMDIESRGSASLLNMEGFRNPFSYTLDVASGIAGESRTVNVDLVETFNYLIGLTVRHVDVIRGVRVVSGTLPNGDRTLILWRDVDAIDNDALDDWFEKQGYSTRDLEYDLIYVNGDNNLENLRRPDQTWKVRLIEHDFRRLMFDVKDVQ